MAICKREGVVYRRHKYKEGHCVKCGASQLAASQAREKRRIAKWGDRPKRTGKSSGNSHQRAIAAEKT
jgi:hypothetical protein